MVSRRENVENVESGARSAKLGAIGAVGSADFVSPRGKEKGPKETGIVWKGPEESGL